MLLGDVSNIREVIAFPTLAPSRAEQGGESPLQRRRQKRHETHLPSPNNPLGLRPLSRPEPAS